ncbi:MFS transporter [Streptomyces albiaxialis]|uniref:MFS transporter n=1 Tax=Streptomyces albiaxialis TaxID=329523 RepID=A0ABN2WVU2_9ACTN
MAREGRVGPDFWPVTVSDSLRSGPFLLFFSARVIAKLGDAMLPIALSAGLIKAGHGPGAIGAALATFTVCFAGFVIFGGVFSDRFNTRWLMIGSDLVRLGTQSLAAVLFLTGHVELWHMCAIGAVNGVAGGMFQPGVAGTIPRIARDVQAANGAIRTAEALAMLAGPALAGMLVATMSAGAVFAAHAGTYALSALCLFLLRLPPRDTRPERTSYRADLVEGWREFRAHTWMWSVIVIWMALMLTSTGPLVPLTASEIISTDGAKVYGLVNSALGAGTALGGLLAMRIRPVRQLRAGSFALLGCCCFPTAVGLGTPVAVMAGGAALSGAGIGFWGVMWSTSVQTQVPAPVLNRIHAYEVAGSLAMMPVGQALAGPASALFGTRAMLLVCGAAPLAVSCALLLVRPVRELRSVTARKAHEGCRTRPVTSRQ